MPAAAHKLRLAIVGAGDVADRHYLPALEELADQVARFRSDAAWVRPCDTGAIPPGAGLTSRGMAAAHHRAMNDRDRQPGPDKSPSGPREANDPGSSRYGTNSGSGSNEPKQRERKETDRGFEPRQGGDQTRTQPSQGDEGAAPDQDTGR